MSVDVLTGSRQEALKEILRKADEECVACGGGKGPRLFLIVSIACAAVYLFLRK